MEEELDYLIIGDVIEEEKSPSPEIYDWVVKFSEISKKHQFVLKSVSSYYISSIDNKIKSFWINLFRDYNLSIYYFPPVLQLKMEKGGLALEKNSFKLIKDYSNDFTEFFIKNKNGGK